MHRSIAVLSTMCALLAGACACGPKPEPTLPYDDPNPPAGFARVTTVAKDSARPSFSPDGKWVLYDRKDDAGHWQVRRVPVEGGDEECLTCGRRELPGHNGAARMHPDGRHVIFASEKADHYPAPAGSDPASPGAGFYLDIVVLDLQTQELFRVREVRGYPDSGVMPPNPGGTLFIRFSPDGSRIAFGDVESTATPGMTPPSRFANYRIGVASFVTTPAPHLENLEFYNPGARPELFEIQDWTPDATGIYTACAPNDGQDDYALELCRYDLATGTIVGLPKTSGVNGEPAEYEEHGAVRPGHGTIAYMSSEGHGIDTSKDFLAWLRSDLWTMNADGSGKTQLTFYNVPGHPESDPDGNRVMFSEMGFSADGKKLAARVYFTHSDSGLSPRKDDEDLIKVFELKD